MIRVNHGQVGAHAAYWSVARLLPGPHLFDRKSVKMRECLLRIPVFFRIALTSISCGACIRAGSSSPRATAIASRSPTAILSRAFVVMSALAASPLSPCGRGVGGEGSAPVRRALERRLVGAGPLIRRHSPSKDGRHSTPYGATFSRKGRRKVWRVPGETINREPRDISDGGAPRRLLRRGRGADRVEVRRALLSRAHSPDSQ